MIAKNMKRARDVITMSKEKGLLKINMKGINMKDQVPSFWLTHLDYWQHRLKLRRVPLPMRQQLICFPLIPEVAVRNMSK